MAEPIAPRAAALPIVFITREAVGYSVQAWQPPVDGWTPLDEPRRVGSDAEARELATPIVGECYGTLGMLIFPPGFTPPDFGVRRK